MRSIGKLNSAPDAATFGDYLYSKGIECQIEDEEDGTFSVWILEDDQMALAADLLKQYTANPGADEFQKVSKAAQKKRADDEKAAQRKRSVVASEERVQYERSFRLPAPVTAALIAICVVVALLTWYQDPALKWYFYFIPQLIFTGEVWRLISPIFIHKDLMHIAFNMFWLYELGGRMEQRLGRWYFGLFVVVTAIASNYSQYLWSGPGFGGMSGVVYALFGFVWMRSRYGRDPAFFIDQNTVTIMLIWLVLCMVGIIPGIANAAHLGGLLAGVAWGFSTRNRFGN